MGSRTEDNKVSTLVVYEVFSIVIMLRVLFAVVFEILSTDE